MGIILSSNICYADDGVICFTEDDAGRMVVELENSNNYKTQVELLKQSNNELEKQIEFLKEINKLQQEQLELSNRTIESYKKLIKTQKDAYETEIKNTKPSTLKTIRTYTSSIGIGILIGALIL